MRAIISKEHTKATELLQLRTAINHFNYNLQYTLTSSV